MPARHWPTSPPFPARRAWHADAACKEHPEVAFFPPLGETAEAGRVVCAGCLVSAECLAAAPRGPTHPGRLGRNDGPGTAGRAAGGGLRALRSPESLCAT